MVNLYNLLVKYSHFSKIDDDIFVYIDRILENVCELHKRQQRAESELKILEKQIAEKQKRATILDCKSPSSPVKKRKAQSLESPRMAYKENVSALEDSTIFPYKSDPEVTMETPVEFEQNILDSEEPLFALTQSPPQREALLPRNEIAPRPSPLSLSPQRNKIGRKSPGKIIRNSRFSRSFISPHTNGTPTATGKWTSKSKEEKLTPSKERTPVGVKRFFSLMDGNDSFRQTKLNFFDPNKSSPKSEPEQMVNDTLFSDFIVPTPPSVSNKSKFLKSLRMKKQSTLVTNQRDGETVEKTPPTAASVFAIGGKGHTPISRNIDDDDAANNDIDQTFCPGVESISKGTNDKPIKIKQEPVSQQRHQQALNHQTNNSSGRRYQQRQPQTSEDTDASEVILLPAASQQSVISVFDSQQENKQFMSALSEERTKRIEATGLKTSPTAKDNARW
uniref:Uncharacterized protein n=1 Tax=Anopheles dirus TaxID=7168 RepID=A0A182NNG4_9DIPT